MTARPTEQDVRAALPARPPADWRDPIDDARPGPDAPSMRVRHPGPGRAVLACGSCGTAMDAADMRRAIPDRPTARSSAAIRPIVCPCCAPTTGSTS